MPRNEDPTEWFTGRIDIIDLATLERVATLRTDHLLAAFAEPGLLLENRTLPDGTPTLVIWRVEVGSGDD